MPGQFGPDIDRVKDNLAEGYQSLLSGNASHVAGARDLIATYRSAGVDFAAMDALDRLKLWIANDQEAKSSRYLDKLHDEAKKAASDPHGTWRAWAYCARVFRYSGRFLKAEQLYAAAMKHIGDKPTQFEEADVFADCAEFKAYLGHPNDALDLLAKIDASVFRAWHYWVQAVAYHFLGFENRQPFPDGTETGIPDYNNKPGDERFYLESNALLDKARTIGKAGDQVKLPSVEVFDTYLLEAANWGAIARRRAEDNKPKQDIDDARQKAKDALLQFKKAADKVNTEWSWKKERRGRLAKFYRAKLDGIISREFVLAWREKFRNHYRENLVEAGVPLASTKAKDDPLRDGEWDGEDDHLDDNDA